jgi:hypothetical protein
MDTMFLPPTSILEPVIYPFADKFYPPAILVKHHVWFLPAANLFISLNRILYGVHQSYFDQSPLFQEVIYYRRVDGIGTDPYYPIPFDTLKKGNLRRLSSPIILWRRTIGTTTKRKMDQH